MIKSGDYQYILLTDGTAELTNYTAYAEFLTVPAQIDGHAVTSIVACHLIKTCAKAWFCVQLSTTHLQL